MELAQLCLVKDRIKVGEPLPFDIRNADKTLLLARGQIISSLEQLQAVLERGALVDMVETRGLQRDEFACAPPEQLPGLWASCTNRVNTVLRGDAQLDFLGALEAAAGPVLKLIVRDPDLAIFQVVRQGAMGRTHYGVTHSLHAAIASYLVARRLGWQAADSHRAFHAALTMNIAMMELQGRLACQVTALTELQRELVRGHPQQSVDMLRRFGIGDADWLQAVGEHHDADDAHVSELAALIRRADIYTAKLSARVTRPALAPNEAGRSVFVKDGGHPMTAALVKEFGVYPPGCYVRLASGETGIVIKRGPRADAPLVASLTNRHGEQLVEPLRRNTEAKEHAIAAIANESSVRVRPSPEKLVLLAST
jgi:HD-GYP domain-containing protein (c-di-GMP phosphodiesterase class II)